ncbi:hypothetical protein BC830DRAFT_1171680 [Chytriomyces sp. MP71]|nr:hypothetical protein BC830DRAFT_1171680 [Chytriomyces sp. MP71]
MASTFNERVVPAMGLRASRIEQGCVGARTVTSDPLDASSVLVLCREIYQIRRISVTKKKASVVLDWSSSPDLGLNHALVVASNPSRPSQRFLLASNAESVFAWPYTSTKHALDPSAALPVVENINGATNGATGRHTTRSLAYNAKTGDLYVQVGSFTNVDSDSKNARIKRFQIFDAAGLIDTTLDFVANGELWADGLRNSVAQTFDERGQLWESNNGPDDFPRQDLVTPHTNVHNDNPAEEINILDAPGKFYGYPFCVTAGNVSLSFATDPVRGSQWSSILGGIDHIRDDAWCRNGANNQPPVAHLPAHSAPIAMTFLKKEDGCGKIKKVSFPCSWVGNLIITLHGSWDRTIPTGFSVVMIPFKNGFPVKSSMNQLNSLVTLLHARDLQTRCVGNLASSCFRPTGVTVVKSRGTLAFDSSKNLHSLFNRGTKGN